MPYTTGCKFAIASLDDGSRSVKLVDGGNLTEKAIIAVREIHNRYDVDLDKLLDQRELAGMLLELLGHELVIGIIFTIEDLTCNRL